MGKGNRNLSEIPGTYPPTLTPLYMGAPPPTKISGSLEEGDKLSYFKNYQDDVLSRFMMPPYDWGLQDIPYTPRPDFVAAKKVRDTIKSFNLPRNNISTISASRMKEIDDFYKGVQLQRQYYKDHTGSLHPLQFFKPDEYAFQCAPQLTPSYLSKYPNHYVEYKTPPVLPLTLERMMRTPYIPELAFPGIYTPGNCIAYKR